MRQPHGFHSRRILNSDELLYACNGTRLGDVKLHCRHLLPGLHHAHKVKLLQKAQIFLTMWGGDTLHSLHMRRGSLVVEMVNEVFAKTGPNTWYNQHRFWITHSRSTKMGHLHYYPLLLPKNGTHISATVKECYSKIQKHPAIPEWDCLWNADMHVEWRFVFKLFSNIIPRISIRKNHRVKI